MELGERLIRWWERVRGRDEEPATAPRIVQPVVRKPQGARPIHPLNGRWPAGELKLAVDSAPDGATARRPGKRGFDPYSSDGGYAKPRGWDDVTRK